MNIDNMSFDEICVKLDSFSLRMLQLMKEYIRIKLIMEDLMKTGYLNLAKARYIMGNRNVSALQLPSEDSNDIYASTTVISKEKNAEDIQSLELNRLNINDQGKNGDNDMRQRIKNKQNGNGTEENNTNKTIYQDPLKWFGVLVPHDMRQAQMNFNKTIDYVVECTNIQLEMLTIEEKYKTYIEKKKQLSTK